MNIVQTDFEQNLSLVSERESQSAHFDKPQVTNTTVLVVLGSVRKNSTLLDDNPEHVSMSKSIKDELIA